jgi:uncharacterized protein YdcH (DUF465 family)
MFGEHHDLIHEFPEHKARIHDLKTSDNHFARLFKDYDELDHELRRVQQEIETPSDDVVEELKKRRLHLKDEMFRMIIAE